ncbi:hypothetical protein [Staphylospora marina]|uniref:hypothetical protein n=1 Tax=Staphylospora marina TaxID=2490858 RepID=UPI000F5BC742|nr:hypothetical protein [Staphylospora marina]
MFLLLATILLAVFLLGIVGVIYPTAFHKRIKLESRLKNVGLSLVAFVLFFVVVLNSPDSSESLPGSWTDEVKRIAASGKTETQKFDEVMALAKKHKPTKDELADFESYIVGEYKGGKYLDDPKNHEYMLGNIFRAAVINEQYDDKEREPIDEFALDFLQNVKYVYRGVESAESPSVKANEEQMNKALERMK